MKLRITTPQSDGHFMSGSAAHVFLDDVEISKYTTRIVLTVDASSAISAEVTFCATDLDIDIPAVIKATLLQSATAKPLGHNIVRKSRATTEVGAGAEQSVRLG